MRNRSLAEIYRQSQHPEYRSSKPLDSYGKWIDKYEPKIEDRKEHSPRTGHVEYRSENKVDSPEHNRTSEDEKKEEPTPQRDLIEKLFQDKPESQSIKKREMRDRDGRIEGGPY